MIVNITFVAKSLVKVFFFFFFVSRRVDTAECNAEPPHLIRTTLINGPQEGCYMHVKITRNEELHVNEKMVINERSDGVTGTPLTDEKATATRRTKTFEKDR